jgi:hypothetical protein
MTEQVPLLWFTHCDEKKESHPEIEIRMSASLIYSTFTQQQQQQQQQQHSDLISESNV